MSFDWIAYISLAQNQFTQTADPNVKPADREALLRSTISRAYYAAFILSRNHLRDKDKDPNIPLFSGAAHSYVIDRFKNNPNKNRKGLGWRLKRLRDLRNMADYDDVFPEDLLIDARTALFEARQVINTLARL